MQSNSQALCPQNSNAELMDYISDQPFVTAEAGYRATYVLWKGQPFEGDFAALAAELGQARIAPESTIPAEQYLDRAAVGRLICRACDIQSGLNWMLTGLGRYAWKELQYRRIAQPGGEMGLISGGEFLGVLTRAEDFTRGQGRQNLGSRSELGAEPGGR